MESGHYLCEIKAIFNEGTYEAECFYDSSLGKFLTTGTSSGNITRRVVRVIREMEERDGRKKDVCKEHH